MSGVSTGNGSGVELSGNVSGGSISGNATGTGTGVAMDGSHTRDVVVKGHSASGFGVKITGDSSSEGGSVTGTTVHGAGVAGTDNLSGSTPVSGAVVSGGDGYPVSEKIQTPDQHKSETRLRNSATHLQTVISQTGQANTAQQAGFHSASGVRVPQRDYRQAEHQVNISVCQDDQCRSSGLDVNSPQDSDTQP
ncbi:hypothetical protein YT14_004656 [Salmonella enterica subsp. enterica serovar Oslo]|nr:hypothetical protein [Salmonella enterica subsp. enterica serovar Oslo]